MFGAGISVGTSGIGPQGAIGAQGDSSAAGAQGSQGSQGSQGILGTAGTAGAAGVAGSAGNQGFQGNQGAQGSQGAQGAQGAASGPPVAGYVVWFDPSDTATITSSGGAVSQFDDKSGNNNDAVQATEANKPVTGSDTINGLNVLTWTASKGMTFTLEGQPAARTWFAVLKQTSAGTECIVGHQNGGVGILARGVQQLDITQHNSADVTFSNNNAVVTNTAQQITIEFTANTSYAYYADGTSFGSGATTVNPTGGVTNTGVLGNRAALDLGWVGLLAEIVIYDSVLSTTDRQSVESYLKTKWGTP